jgi:hypothetical protein
MDHGTRDELHRSSRPAFLESSEGTTDDDSEDGVLGARRRRWPGSLLVMKNSVLRQRLRRHVQSPALRFCVAVASL